MSTNAGERCTILIADDAEEIRYFVRWYLELDGRFDVIAEATDGRQAIEVATAERPDVVILDISMPVLDGLQALQKIRALSPTTKVVMLSGLDDPDVKAQALAAGAEGYFVKTSELEDVLETIASLCPG